MKRVNTRSENPMWLLSAMRGFELVPTEQEVSFVLNLGPNDEYVAAIVRTDGNVELVRSEYFVNFRNLFIDPATGTFSPELMQENGVARFRFFRVLWISYNSGKTVQTTNQRQGGKHG